MWCSLLSHAAYCLASGEGNTAGLTITFFQLSARLGSHFKNVFLESLFSESFSGIRSAQWFKTSFRIRKLSWNQNFRVLSTQNHFGAFKKVIFRNFSCFQKVYSEFLSLVISTVSVYFGVSKPVKNLGIFMVSGGFGVSKPEKTLVFSRFGMFLGSKTCKKP